MKSVALGVRAGRKELRRPCVRRKKRSTRARFRGWLRTLDPHSNFVDPAEYREMQRRQRAQYYGVGMEIVGDSDGHVVVMRPFPGSPAFNAGFRRGDIISAVDGKDVSKLGSNDVSQPAARPRGTQVRVTVKREGVADLYPPK